MRKNIIFLVGAICLITLAGGCGQTPANDAEVNEPSKTDSIEFSDSQLYAVAWVGYNDLSELSYYLENYIDTDSVPIHYLSGGDYYLIIPRYENTEMQLYQNDIVTDTSALVFEDADCGPFLLQCNVSDIFSDATIKFTYQEETVEFSPYFSLEDGSLKIGERGLDLTKQNT